MKTGFCLAMSFAIVTTSLSPAQTQPPGERPLFAPPVLFAPGVVSTPDFQFNAAFTPDGNTVYFSKSDPGFNRITIVLSRRRNGQWTTPEVAPFSGIWKDTDPFVAPDGSKLFFISNRPTGFPNDARKDYDIWYVERTATGAWGEPIHIPAPVNSDGFEMYPSVNRDGTLYFCGVRSEHPGPHLYRSRLVNGQYTIPELLPFSGPGSDLDPTIAADDSFIVFSSRDRGGEGQGDLFVSFHHGDNWTTPKNLGSVINSSFSEIATGLSPDNHTLYFASNRMNAPLPRKARVNYDELEAELHAIDNGLMKIYQVNIENAKRLDEEKR
jgi:Tol biopolymer transport system component